MVWVEEKDWGFGLGFFFFFAVDWWWWWWWWLMVEVVVVGYCGCFYYSSNELFVLF